jgi:hypothetical protein
MAASIPGRLSKTFFDATQSSRIGGSSVLKELGNLARMCIAGPSPRVDAVAFALSVIFDAHADDLEDRPVTGDDTYVLMASGYDDLARAVRFVETDGTPEQATNIIAALARLTPAHLYGH